MYPITVSASGWLTENAPYPACQWNFSNSGSLVLTISTILATGRVRERPEKKIHFVSMVIAWRAGR
jgi:hypothetical protein